MNTRENSMPLSLDILPLSNILKYSHNVPQDLILSHNMYIKTIIWGFVKRLAHFIYIIFTFSLLWQTTKLLWMRLLQRQFCLLLNVIQCMLLFKTFLGVTHVLLSVRFLDSLSLCLSLSPGLLSCNPFYPSFYACISSLKNFLIKFQILGIKLLFILFLSVF